MSRSVGLPHSHHALHRLPAGAAGLPRPLQPRPPHCRSAGALPQVPRPTLIKIKMTAEVLTFTHLDLISGTSGCCPFASWFCCEDNLSCALSLEDCPAAGSVSVAARRVRANLEPCPSGDMTTSDSSELAVAAGWRICFSQPDLTTPPGCCPFSGWYCCENNRLCAQSPEDCPA